MITVSDTIAGKSFLRTEVVSCPLCGSSTEPRKIAARFGMTAMVSECNPCRIAYQSPRPSEEACIAYMDWRWSSGDAYVTDNKAKRDTASAQMKIVSNIRPKLGRLLDFGAGSGAFVRAAIDAGWIATGVEHSPVAVQQAKKFYDVDLLAELPADKFDVITLWDVVEHLKDPIGLLAHLKTLLAPGGLIVLETGNYESWLRISRGDAWGLYLLDHHYYFTPGSLKQVLRKAGFTDAKLAGGERVRPSLGKAVRHPVSGLKQWGTWMASRRKWPEHSDIHEMIVTASA